VEDRTGLVVTHRFTTAMHADVIYVMRDNAIVESGTHAELLAAGGVYAASWQEQIQDGWRSDATSDVRSGT
jgi:ATP-binding cassette subfamily B protein